MPCSASHVRRSKKYRCLLHSMPAIACRITSAASGLAEAGVIAA